VEALGVRKDFQLLPSPLNTYMQNGQVTVTCTNCRQPFLVYPGYLDNLSKRNIKPFCSKTCSKMFRTHPRVLRVCLFCKSSFTVRSSSAQKFCNQTCSATYNNTHKQHGTTQSKLEVWLRAQLTALYPTLEIHYCRKDAINSELDIYIPSLKLAFELNGIYHYEPIHGESVLAKIQNNDSRKFQACLERKIELCIIDTTGQKVFKTSTSAIYLSIVEKHINLKLLSVV